MLIILLLSALKALNLKFFFVNFNKMQILKIFRKVFSEKFEKSTIHGVAHIIRSKNWTIFIVWFLLFLTSCSFCLYTIVDCFSEYFQYDVTIEISRENEFPAIFPAVTICNMNPFNPSQIVAFQYIYKNVNGAKCFSIKDGGLFLKCLNNVTTFQGIGFSNIFDTFLDTIKRIVAADNKLTGQNRSSLGYLLDNQMLVSCQYNGRTCSQKNGDFTWFWNNNYGNCYTFNGVNQPTAILKTTSTREQSGLQLELITSALIYIRELFIREEVLIFWKKKSTSEFDQNYHKNEMSLDF